MELVLNDTMYCYQPKHSQTLVDIRTMSCEAVLDVEHVQRKRNMQEGVHCRMICSPCIR